MIPGFSRPSAVAGFRGASSRHRRNPLDVDLRSANCDSSRGRPSPPSPSLTQCRSLAPHGRRRRAQEVRHRHTRHLHRVPVLREETRALIRSSTLISGVPAVEGDGPGRDAILRVAGDGVRRRRLARPVSPSPRASPDFTGEVHAPESVVFALRRVPDHFDVDVEVPWFPELSPLLDSVMANSLFDGVGNRAVSRTSRGPPDSKMISRRIPDDEASAPSPRGMPQGLQVQRQNCSSVETMSVAAGRCPRPRRFTRLDFQGWHRIGSRAPSVSTQLLDSTPKGVGCRWRQHGSRRRRSTRCASPRTCPMPISLLRRPLLEHIDGSFGFAWSTGPASTRKCWPSSATHRPSSSGVARWRITEARPRPPSRATPAAQSHREHGAARRVLAEGRHAVALTCTVSSARRRVHTTVSRAACRPTTELDAVSATCCPVCPCDR